MDATSNTSETDDEEGMGHGQQETIEEGKDLHEETEDHAASMVESQPSTTAEETDELHFCNDEEYKRKLDDLKVKEKETSARLETVERRLTQTEAKMRSCDDMLVLIGLLTDRLKQVYDKVGPLQGGEDAPKGQPDFATVPRAN